MNEEEKKLHKELYALKQEHQDLDHILLTTISSDLLTIQRFKKRKLWLKDRIATIESAIYPDISA
jgi:hypothetical protein